MTIFAANLKTILALELQMALKPGSIPTSASAIKLRLDPSFTYIDLSYNVGLSYGRGWLPSTTHIDWEKVSPRLFFPHLPTLIDSFAARLDVEAPDRLTAAEFVVQFRELREEMLQDFRDAIIFASTTKELSTRILAGFVLENPFHNLCDQPRYELLAFTGEAPCVGFFPVRNLHDLGAGKKRARRYGFCRFSATGIDLVLPEGERCTSTETENDASILPARVVFRREDLTDVRVTNQEIRFRWAKATRTNEDVILIHGHKDEDPKRAADLARFCAVFGTYTDLRTAPEPPSLSRTALTTTEGFTDFDTLSRPPKQEFLLVNCWAPTEPASCIAVIDQDPYLHVVFESHGIHSFDRRAPFPEALERQPYQQREEKCRSRMGLRYTRRPIEQSIDPHPLPAPQIAHCPLPWTRLHAAAGNRTHLFLADHAAGLLVVQHPHANPVVSKIIPQLPSGKAIAYEYLAIDGTRMVLGTEQGFVLFDISNGDEPRQAPTPTGSAYAWIWSPASAYSDAVLYGPWLFLSTKWSGLLIVDVTVLDAPKLIRTITIPETSSRDFGMSRLKIVGHHLMIACFNDQSCTCVLDLTSFPNPTQCVIVPFASFAQPLASAGGAQSFIGFKGDAWTVSLGSNSCEVEHLDLCSERWGERKHSIENTIDGARFDADHVLIADLSGQVSLLRQQPWAPNLPKDGTPLPESDCPSQKICAELQRIVREDPAFVIGSVVVKIGRHQDEGGGGISLIVNPPSRGFAALFDLAGSRGKGWRIDSLIHDERRAEISEGLLSRHESFRHAFARNILNRLAALLRTPEMLPHLAQRVMVSSPITGIHDIVVTGRRT